MDGSEPMRFEQRHEVGSSLMMLKKIEYGSTREVLSTAKLMAFNTDCQKRLRFCVRNHKGGSDEECRDSGGDLHLVKVE